LPGHSRPTSLSYDTDATTWAPQRAHPHNQHVPQPSHLTGSSRRHASPPPPPHPYPHPWGGASGALGACTTYSTGEGDGRRTYGSGALVHLRWRRPESSRVCVRVCGCVPVVVVGLEESLAAGCGFVDGACEAQLCLPLRPVCPAAWIAGVCVCVDACLTCIVDLELTLMGVVVVGAGATHATAAGADAVSAARVWVAMCVRRGPAVSPALLWDCCLCCAVVL